MKNSIYLFMIGALSMFVVAETASAGGIAPLHLGTATRFAVLAGTGISNVPRSSIGGDIGVSPAGRATLTGFELSGDREVTGYLYAADDNVPSSAGEMLKKAHDDIAAAVTDAAGRTATGEISGNIGGKTFGPGVYQSSGAIELSGGEVTLNGGGDPNAVWIFKIGGPLTIASNRSIVLSAGAHAQNIFWQIAGTVTFGSGVIFNGNIIAEQSVTLGAMSRINGRVISRNGSVAIAYNTIELPEERSAIPFMPAVPTPGSLPATTFAPMAPVIPVQSATQPSAPIASTNDQLAALLAILADLEKQVAAQSATAPAPAPVSAAPKSPVTSSAPVHEVKSLQIFLNTHGFKIAESGPGSPGNETTTFGVLTRKALCKFQVSEGIVNSEKSAACGVYGPKTKARIKAMSI